MILDLRTMYVVVSMTCIVLGAMQLAAYATRRFERWPGWWGLSNILVGLGTLGIGLRGYLPDVVTVDLSNIVTLAGYLLLVVSVKVFAGRPVRWWRYGAITAVAALLFMFLWGDPADYRARIAFFSMLCAAFDLMIVREGLRLARREPLASAWLLVGLFGMTSAIFAIRTVLALGDDLNGSSLFASQAGLYQWLAVTANIFVTLRGLTLLLMGAERSQQRLLALAQADPLTGALNRVGLQRMAARLAQPRPGGRAAAVAALVIDLDHFKAINDTCGHEAGDSVLRLFVAVARQELRRLDILARQGGDEFVVLLPHASLQDAAAIAERIRRAFAKAPLDFASRGVRPTLSIGVAEGDIGAEGLEAILHRADTALYRSKRQGRNRVSGAAG